MDTSPNPIYNDQQLNKLSDLLDNILNVVIVCHVRPDGDAVGSMQALGLVLSDAGYAVTCIAPTEIPDALAWQSRAMEFTMCGDKRLSPKISKRIQESELIIGVDLNDFTRTDQPLDAALRQSKAPTVLIDHHEKPNTDFSLLFSDTEASSTCEIAFEILSRLFGMESITPEVASSLYMGLVTDTGSFSYACRPRTFEVAARLLEAGADTVAIRNHVYGSMREEAIRLCGHSSSQLMYRFANDLACIIPLSSQTLLEYKFRPGDTEGLVNEPLRIAGVKLSALLTERPWGVVNISLRSRGDIAVEPLAREAFNGGGHMYAAGGNLEMTFLEAVEYTVQAIERYIARELKIYIEERAKIL